MITYVVGSGESAVGSPDLTAGGFEALECLLWGVSETFLRAKFTAKHALVM